MRAGAHRLDHTADRSISDKLPGEDRALHVEALAKIDHVFLSGAERRRAGLVELRQRGERGFIGEIIAPGFHDLAPERPAQIRDGGRRNKADIRILKNLIQASGGLRLRKRFLEGRDFYWIGIEDPADLAAGFHEAVALSVDVAVVEGGGREHEFAGAADRSRFPFGGIVHSVFHKEIQAR